MTRCFTVAAFALCAPMLASAHEVRPAFLNLTQSNETTWQVHWKVPTKSGSRLALYILLPEEATAKGEPVRYMEGDAFVERWSFAIAEGQV